MYPDAIIPVLIAEDQVVMRIGLRAVLQRIPGIHVVGEAADGVAAVEMAGRLHPAVILMDIGMPGLDGIQATRAIKELQPAIRVIMFTTNDDNKAFMSALAAGADGYCMKDATETQLAGAINAVMQGATWLDSGVAGRALRTHTTPQAHNLGDTREFSREQRQILKLVKGGLNFIQIAEDLNSPVAVLKQELRAICEKLSGTQDDAGSASTTYRRLKEVLNTTNSYSQSNATTSQSGILGQTLAGKYRVEAVIGEGGMSTVYRARHTLIDKVVAVKMLHRHLLADSTSVKRLQNEARAAGSISHPNIIAVHDFGITDDRQPYLVMDYVVGETMAEKLEREETLPLKQSLQLLIQVCEALSVLHVQGIIHRDLKPSNIMLVQENNRLSAKLVDFGIAKTIANTPSGEALTLTGEVFGSPPFMSPEQCLGSAVDNRSDLYSLGCILYVLLTGAPPFDGGEPLNIMWQQVHESPSRLPFLSQIHGIPIHLQAILFRLMDKTADKRFQSANELKIELEKVLSALEPLTPTSK